MQNLKKVQDPGMVASAPIEEQTYEDLRKKFSLNNNKAASRLRARCHDYTAEVSDEN